VATITIAAAQTIPFDGEVRKNMDAHAKLIALAAEKKVNLIVFPELSLTGYELSHASQLAFTIYDDRLMPLVTLAEKHKMTVVVGVPLLLDSNLYIGALIISPDRSISPYAKHHVHDTEKKVFQAGHLNPKIYLTDEQASLAICADITHPVHAENAALSGSTLYLAGVFITPEGIEKESALLKGYASKYKMAVIMANYGGESGGMQSAGKSTIWSDTGGKVVMMETVGEGLVIAKKENGKWTGKVLQ
jgi:predicted amidohydrolase